MGGPVQLCALENRIKLFLVFLTMVDKGGISFHEIIDICDFPRPKAIFSHPLDQCFQFIAALEMFWSHHLVLHDAEMFPGVDFFRNIELRNIQPQRRFYSDQNSQQHSLVAIIGCFILLRIDEILVVLSDMLGRIGDQPKLIRLRKLDIIIRFLILVTIHRKPPKHDPIDDLARFRNILQEILILLNFYTKPIFPGFIYRLQCCFLQPLLPILLHILLVTVSNRIKGGLKHLQQVLIDPSLRNFVIGKYSFRKISEPAFIAVFGAANFNWKFQFKVDKVLSLLVQFLELLDSGDHLLIYFFLQIFFFLEFLLFQDFG